MADRGEHVTGSLEILPIAGLPELRPGDDLAALICRSAPWLRDGDILVITSKAVSKVEGRLIAVPTDPAGRERARQQAVVDQTVRVVAERGATTIVETPQGWVMAAGGVDASNVTSGELALLPVDADASARGLREAIGHRTGIVVAVVITDTNGRTWRRGLVDVAIGVAGMAAVLDLRGLPDTSGVPLEVTEIAVADELASAADLVKGKLSRTPAAVIRGLTPPPDDDRGSAALRRPIGEDMFRLGTRDVVRTRRDPAAGFGPGLVPIPVLRSAIEAAVAATGNAGSIDGGPVLALLPDNAWREADTGTTADARAATTSAAVRFLAQADAVIVPLLTDPADAEAITRLGMAIAALLIALHAEGLAATWLSPEDIAGMEPVPASDTGRPHGLVAVGPAVDLRLRP